MNPHHHQSSTAEESVAKTKNPKAYSITVDQEILLRIIFKLIDVDNSGDLSRSELIKAMRKDPYIGTAASFSFL
jgi:Ca2+-binding EF-hand superfamily protein